MATMTKVKIGEYVYCGEAARIIDSTREVVRALARKGRVGMLAIPGTRPRYRRSDLERLTQDGLKQAQVAG